MATLRVVLDPVLGPGGIGRRYAEMLARALIASAPDGTRVSGVISAIPDQDAEMIRAGLPGLDALYRSRIARRELRAAWQHGIAVVPGDGLLHATDLTAPLSRHDRRRDLNSQVVVTVHDTLAWTRPDAVEPAEGARRRAMGARAARYADAIVVPNHAVADALNAELGVGERVRVIAAAPHLGVNKHDDGAALRAEVGLPARYLVTVLRDDAGSWSERIIDILNALPSDVQFVVVSRSFAQPAGVAVPAPRMTFVAGPDDRSLAAVIAGAIAYIELGLELGFGLPVLAAMALGIPVVHRHADDAGELMAGAGLAVDDSELSDAIRGILDDADLRDRLALQGRDRARAFSWRDSAEKVWQLHADL